MALLTDSTPPKPKSKASAKPGRSSGGSSTASSELLAAIESLKQRIADLEALKEKNAQTLKELNAELTALKGAVPTEKPDVQKKHGHPDFWD